MSYIGHTIETGALQPLDPTLTALAALDATVGQLNQTGEDTFNKLSYPPTTYFDIGASVTANALTVTLEPCVLSFRNASYSNGSYTMRTIPSQLSLTVTSGSTLGTINAVTARLIVIAIDNDGTVELAIGNLSGGLDLTETFLVTTTAEGGTGTADAKNVIYSAVARTAVPFRVVGYIDITQATAGTWVTAPEKVVGGTPHSLSSLTGLGVGQSWQTPAGRALGTTYYNTTGKPILVSVRTSSTVTTGCQAFVDDLEIAFNQISVSGSTNNQSVSAIVPPGSSYRFTAGAGGSLSTWRELR